MIVPSAGSEQAANAANAPFHLLADMARDLWIPALVCSSGVQATSGGALYRRATFLLDSLGKPVMSEHIDIDAPPIYAGRAWPPG